MAETASEFADDPAVLGFRAYVDVVSRTLQSGGLDEAGVTDVMTGITIGSFRAELASYRDNGWRLAGAMTLSVVGVETVDLTHTRLNTCELESASFPVDAANAPTSPVDDGWTPSQYWMVFVEGAWKLEGLYVSEHSCDAAV
nr:hypothetical protein [Micromonospora sp. DSM 115978]